MVGKIEKVIRLGPGDSSHDSSGMTGCLVKVPWCLLPMWPHQ